MAIIAREGGNSFPQLAPGSYPARCYGVILIGTIYDDLYGKSTTKVLVQFEFPSECIDAPDNPDLHGQPYGMSKFYTLSLHEKATLRADLERWRNKPFTKEELAGFDLKNIIGAPCMVAVVKKEDGKSKISSVSALPKGMSVLPQINPVRYFDIEEDASRFDDLPKGIQDMIKKSDEYRNLFGTGSPDGTPAEPTFDDEEDTIPF
jgi:hypothetical protein